jgi:hypothetical protein
MPPTHKCPTCGDEVVNIIASPAVVNIERDWNEKANSYRINPYTQAKAQLTNMDRENQNYHGAKPMKITEAMIQATAKQIDESNRGVNRPESPVIQTQKKQIEAKKKNSSIQV